MQVLLDFWIGGALALALNAWSQIDWSRFIANASKTVAGDRHVTIGMRLGLVVAFLVYGVLRPLTWPARFPYRIARAILNGQPDAGLHDVLAAAATWHRMHILPTYALGGQRGELLRRATDHLVSTIEAMGKRPAPDIRHVGIRLPEGAAIPAPLSYYDVLTSELPSGRAMGVYVPEALTLAEAEFARGELADLVTKIDEMTERLRQEKPA